jgi:hypothetical protein
LLVVPTSGNAKVLELALTLFTVVEEDALALTSIGVVEEDALALASIGVVEEEALTYTLAFKNHKIRMFY